MSLLELDLSNLRNVARIKDKQCYICGVDLLDAPKPVWSRRRGGGTSVYYCTPCKEEKFSGVLIRDVK